MFSDFFKALNLWLANVSSVSNTSKLSIFRKEECSLIHYSLGWAAGVVRSQQQPGHWRSGPDSPMLVGNCREAPCTAFMQPSSKSWKDFKFMCFFKVSETQILLLFSKVASAVSVISNQKCNVNFIYFHTLLYEKIKRGTEAQLK